MIKHILAKTILSKIKNGPDNYFGLLYNMNLYRGCQHQCIYCDSRSKCYQIENFSDILIKQNALELFEKELKSKRVKGTIGFGSMNDAYMPVEKEKELTQKALEIVSKYKYPIHIITKSDLVLRDIDLISRIGKTYAAITITITASNDELSKKIEPGAPPSSERFKAIKVLSENGIYTGITLMPVLPFITDSPENIEEIIIKAKESGAKYILACMGTTQREGQREYFYKELDKKFPGLKEKYIKKYGDRYECMAPEANSLYGLLGKLCKENSISQRMVFFSGNKSGQHSLF